MARGDGTIRDRSGYAVIPTQNWGVAAGTPITVKQGEPTKYTTLPDIIPCVDDDVTVGTDTRFTGLAQSDSTETASAAGSVECYVPLTGVVYAMKATTSSNFNTVALITAAKGLRETFDLISSTFTFDENAGDGATNALCIVGGDATTATVYFTIVNDATYLGWNA